MKLHELLAINGNLETQANKVLTDLANTFEKKPHHFSAKIVSFTSSVEDLKSAVESQSEIQTTVPKELEWVCGHLAKSVDSKLQIAVANTQARADILLEDGTPLIKDVPATALLELEKELSKIHALALHIPTLDPAKGFTVDAGNNGYWKAREVVGKIRTRKEKVVIVKYAATPEHPAQTELIDKDVPVGTINEQEWSSLITPTRKSEIINNIEILIRAVKQARSRANEQEVERVQIGSVLFGKIFG